MDTETNMEAFQLRLWDGRIGRWLFPDPMGQYASPYLGMGNNPISMIDPDGGWETWARAAWEWTLGGFRGNVTRNPADDNIDPSRNFGIKYKDGSVGGYVEGYNLREINVPVIRYTGNKILESKFVSDNLSYTSTHQFGVKGMLKSRFGDELRYKLYASEKIGQGKMFEINDTFFEGRDEGRNYQLNITGASFNFRPKDFRVRVMAPGFLPVKSGLSISENGVGVHYFASGKYNTGAGADITLKPSKETIQVIVESMMMYMSRGNVRVSPMSTSSVSSGQLILN